MKTEKAKRRNLVCRRLDCRFDLEGNRSLL
jgi:hypothetical protein